MPVFSFCLEYNITDRPESFCWVRRTPRYRHSPNTRHQRVIIIIFLSPLSVWVWWCGLGALISMQFLYESFVWIIWFHLLHQANRVIGFFLIIEMFSRAFWSSLKKLETKLAMPSLVEKFPKLCLNDISFSRIDPKSATTRRSAIFGTNLESDTWERASRALKCIRGPANLASDLHASTTTTQNKHKN